MKQTCVAAALVGTWVAFGPGVPVAAVSPASAAIGLAQNDLDEFMRQVLAKRDENWKKLKQYVLDEHEKVDVIGPALVPIIGQRRDYRWFIRDGYFVRSPLTFDGVTVPETERRKFEDDYLRQAKERDRRASRARGAGPGAATGAAPAGDTARGAQSASSDQTLSPATMENLLTQTRQPQFIDSAYFLRFKFEQGKYALVGREKFDGREVLRIEYYPARLFSDNQDRASRQATAGKPAPDKRQDLEIERLMNKNSLVTLWVEPAARQIVKYAFDNIQTDFLPISWLFRLDDFKASMTMSQPFKDVWLPKDVNLVLKVMFAIGIIDLRYHLDYVDYKEASTSGRIRRGGAK